MSDDFRKFVAMQMLSLAVVLVSLGSMAFVLIQHQAGRYGTIVATAVTVGFVLLGYATVSVGVAIAGSGYCRAFWQLFGFDFSPDKDGETA
jgi:uncharacterized membrane protein